MYCDPGLRSTISAARAWDELAARLYDLAADHSSTTAKLIAQRQEPSATPPSQAAVPYAAWLNAIAQYVKQTAVHAQAAVNAYESALTAMVPPPVIHANRMLRTLLATANWFGQSSPAIADTDAAYEHMWARNADAVREYAAASAGATTMAAPSSPPEDTGLTEPTHVWMLQTAPGVISTGRQQISAIPETLAAFSSSPLATIDPSVAPVTAQVSRLNSLAAPLDFAINHLNALNRTTALFNASTLRSLTADPNGINGTGYTAAFGHGTSIGSLSVPYGWTTPTTAGPATEERLHKSLLLRTDPLVRTE